MTMAVDWDVKSQARQNKQEGQVALNCSPEYGLKLTYEPCNEISNNVVCGTSKSSDQPAYTGRLVRAFASRLKII